MASLETVKLLIRFGLEQLSVKNAAHTFERLCFELAKKRICSNILPATGPVSAGGDQGRDFETFRTYLNTTDIANSTFVGLISQTPIAFACSLEKTIYSKIKSDVTKIMSSGSPVEATHILCSADVPVAKRHELEAWAKNTYSVQLVIHDGQAISDLLTDPEVFWIAKQYLDIPDEVYPSQQLLPVREQPKPVQKHQYPQVSGYLTRRVVQAKDSTSITRVLLREESAEDLLTTIRKQRRVVLLANAGAGKTTELKHIAAYYSSDDSPFYPHLVFLNKYVNQSIEEMLPPRWNEVPDEQQLVILDGLDEIESKNKNDAIRRIELFAEKHPNVHIVISCRTNFYRIETDYASGKPEGFSPYILLDLSRREIDEYVQKRLGDRAGAFMRLIADNHLEPLLYIPFYLVSLVDLYEANGSLPESKAQIFEQLLDSRIRHDIRKYRTTIPDLDEKRRVIVQTLERLALSMETLGRNYISDEEFQELVPEESLRDLVKYCTVWKRVGEPATTWQFDHNNFQEYLAASVLARQEVLVIKEFISFRPDYNRVIPSWTNTVSFLVSILDKDRERHAASNEKLGAILDWIKESEPELIIKFEPDKIDAATRIQMFKDIFNDYKEKSIVIDRAKFPLGELARFGQSEEVVEFLITEAEKRLRLVRILHHCLVL